MFQLHSLEFSYIEILGIYQDNGKENGNCYLGFRVTPSSPPLHTNPKPIDA